MRLTRFSDYSLRVLMYLGAKKEKSSIAEISRAYNLPANHLVKVVHNLVNLGYIHSARGKNGGIILAKNPEQIRIGKVIEQVESDLDLVECFNPATNTCRIAPSCRLQGFLKQARKDFFTSLNRHSLGDIIRGKGLIGELTGADAPTPPNQP